VVRLVVLLGVLGAAVTYGVQRWQDHQAEQAIVDGKAPSADQVRDGLSEEAARVTLRGVCSSGTGVAGFAEYRPERRPEPLVLNSASAYGAASTLYDNGPVRHPIALVYMEQESSRRPLAIRYRDDKREIVPEMSELQLVGCVTDAPNNFCDGASGPFRPQSRDLIFVTLRAITTGEQIATLVAEYTYPLNQNQPCDVRVGDYDDARLSFEYSVVVYAKTP